MEISVENPPVYFAPPLPEFALEIGIGAWSQKTRMMMLPEVRKVLRYV